MAWPVILVDSSVWIDAFAGRSTAQAVWLRRELEIQKIGLPDLVLCEVLQGVRSDEQFRKLQRYFADLAVLPIGGEGNAVMSAHNYRYLRSRGITVRTSIDCMIATFCIEQGHSLLHSDADFDHFEQHLGLVVVHP